VEDAIWQAFDYVKVGPYKPECGPLNERTTNQRLYHHTGDASGELHGGRRFCDITARFWHRGIDPLR
jgi:anaerobic ribonucleoside-triphosphate reductase activating protein